MKFTRILVAIAAIFAISLAAEAQFAPYPYGLGGVQIVSACPTNFTTTASTNFVYTVGGGTTNSVSPFLMPSEKTVSLWLALKCSTTNNGSTSVTWAKCWDGVTPDTNTTSTITLTISSVQNTSQQFYGTNWDIGAAMAILPISVVNATYAAGTETVSIGYGIKPPN